VRIDYSEIFAPKPAAVAEIKGRLAAEPVLVPSYVGKPHYAGNFAKQWQQFRDTQLDSVNGTSISLDFLQQLLNAPVDTLADKVVLEIGAGAGRFTEHLVRHARLVVAIDLSEAIYHNAALGARNLVAAQADLFAMPQAKVVFDVVLCRGVLQHTPSPIEAIGRIHNLVGPGGMVVFDIYRPMRMGRFDAKYIWRPIVQKLFSYESFAAFLDRNAGRLLKLRWGLKPFLPWKAKRLLDYAIPVWDYKGVYPLDDRQLIEWCKLDTMDAMFAKFDSPMRYDKVVEAIAGLGAELVWSDRRMNFFVSRAKGAPARAPATMIMADGS